MLLGLFEVMKKLFDVVQGLGAFGIALFYVAMPGFWFYGLYWSFTHHHLFLALVELVLPPVGAVVGVWATAFG